MENLLIDQEQWVPVDTSTKPTSMLKEDWDKLDRKASTIHLCLSNLLLLNVSREYIAKKLWEKLGNPYQSKSLVNELFLQKKLYDLTMENGDFMTEHINAFNTVVGQPIYVDIKMEKEDKCITMLCSLPNLWHNLVVAIGSIA